MVYIGMTYTVTAYIVTSDIVMACLVMAYITVAYLVTAYVVMAYKRSIGRSGGWVGDLFRAVSRALPIQQCLASRSVVPACMCASSEVRGVGCTGCGVGCLRV